MSTRNMTEAEDAPAANRPGVGGHAGRGRSVILRDLHRSFGDVRALDGLTLEIAAGELVVLLGPSGCGKTTALRVLAGLEDIDAGAVVVGGREISGLPTSKRNMGMVFQAYSLFPHLTARDNVAFGLRLRNKGAGERNRVSADYLQLVGLADKAGQYPHQLSGGQQQRVALARALAIAPEVLLLDEPLSALDAKVRVQLRDEIRRLQREVGTTTLFVTHDQEEALAVADRVGVMKAGRLEQIDRPETIYSRPTTQFVAEFVGLTNRLPGIATGGTAVALGTAVPLLPGSIRSGPVTLLVRPEAVRLAAPGTQTPAHTTGTVVAISYLGAYGRIRVRLPDETLLLAQVAAVDATALGVGDLVAVNVSSAGVLAVDSQVGGGGEVRAAHPDRTQAPAGT